jgi:predicted DNA-binding protein
MLDKLAKKTGRTKQDLLREAIHTLLLEYRMFDEAKAKAKLRRNS